MAVTVEDAAEYVGASSGDALVARLFDVAADVIADTLGSSGLARCPVSLRELATLQLTSELWERSKSPNGVAQWGPDGNVVRLARDAMASVKPLIQKYVKLGAVG